MNIRRDVFQAIADPSRRAILSLVALQAMTPGAIAENFNSTRQTISKHIHILTECQLLQPKHNGREIFYQINPQKMKEIADWLTPFQQLWEDRFNRMDDVLDKLKKQ